MSYQLPRGWAPDWGDPFPSDKGFIAQEIINKEAYGELDASPKPYLNLRNYTVKKLGGFPLQQLKGGISIDLRKTVVTDSWNPDGKPARLGSLIYGIDENGKLQLDLNARLADADHPDTSAHFNDVLRITEDGENLALRLEAHVTTAEDQSGTARLTDVLTTADDGTLAVVVSAAVVSEPGGMATKFSDVLFVGAEKLSIDAGALIHKGGNDAPFDFRFDDESGKYGAGTAFLKD